MIATARKRKVLIAATGLAVVAVATITVVATRGSDSSASGVRTTSSPSPGLQFDAKSGGNLSLTPTPLAPGRSEADPAAAVRRFLDAEIAKDWTSSFAVLADDDRAAAAPARQWAASHVNLPRYTAYRLVGAPVVDGPSATVVAEVDMTPGLDPVAGLRPAHARITWSTVQQGGGWRVALRRSTSVAAYADESGAPAAALAWAASRQRCGHDGEYEGGVVGLPAVAASLCGTTGSYRASVAAPLASLTNPAAIIDSYGPDAGTWARVVRLDGPVPLRVVLAPVGARWLVVGVTTAAA